MTKIRKRRRKALVDMEACMEIKSQTLKQIEEGRRPLPPLISPSGTSIGVWFESWARCVEATADEINEVTDILMRIVLGGLGDM